MLIMACVVAGLPVKGMAMLLMLLVETLRLLGSPEVNKPLTSKLKCKNNDDLFNRSLSKIISFEGYAKKI